MKQDKVALRNTSKSVIKACTWPADIPELELSLSPLCLLVGVDLPPSLPLSPVPWLLLVLVLLFGMLVVGATGLKDGGVLFCTEDK